MFARSCVESALDEGHDAELEAIGIFELVEVLRDLLKQTPPEPVHEVVRERLSVAERVTMLLKILEGCQSLVFDSLLSIPPTREELVVTFLAMLELVKLRTVRIMQNQRCGSIWLFPLASDPARELPLQDESFGYC